MKTADKLRIAHEPKVWGGYRGGTIRTIVKAATIKRARELLASAGMRVSDREFSDYWAVTRNVLELEVSSASIEGVWLAFSRVGPHSLADYRRRP